MAAANRRTNAEAHKNAALRARVSELEAQLAADRKALDDATAPCHGLGCGRCESCVGLARAELAAANADRARLRAGVEAVANAVANEHLLTQRGFSYAFHDAVALATAALASSDAAAWLRERDMRVTEAVRAFVCGQLRDEYTMDLRNRAQTAMVVHGLNLAAVVAGVK